MMITSESSGSSYPCKPLTLVSLLGPRSFRSGGWISLGCFLLFVLCNDLSKWPSGLLHALLHTGSLQLEAIFLHFQFSILDVSVTIIVARMVKYKRQLHLYPQFLGSFCNGDSIPYWIRLKAASDFQIRGFPSLDLPRQLTKTCWHEHRDFSAPRHLS